jgi:glycosyltransferase involved in cell wall biosynthesis
MNIAGLISFCIFVLRLRALVLSIAPDLIHANVPKSHLALFLLARSGYDGACVFHVREIFSGKSIAFRLYQRLFLNRSHVIAISQAVKDALPAVMRRRCLAIRNGVAIPPEPLRFDQISARKLRLLYLGRIVQWKGCHYLLDLLEALALRYPQWDIRLTLIGGSFYGGEAYRARLCRRIAGMEHGPAVALLDHVESPQSVYLSHDVFCNASYQEPFGRVLAEASASAMPVVSFDTGGVGEIVENGVTGFLVPYGDLEAFVAAVGRFVEDPLLVGRMGAMARKKAERELNASVQIPQIVEHLGDCILD